MNKKEIQRKRMMSYFINAADRIIKEEGINQITIRKVADYAGYNSATLYNYFENLDHLVFFAAMRSIKDYALALPDYTKNAKDALERFLLVWECFCNYSYRNPDIYYAIFFAKLHDDLEKYILDYYRLFPEDLGDPSEGLTTMLLKHNIYERGETSLDDCIKEGFIKEEDKKELNEFIFLTYESILLRVIRARMDYKEAIESAMKYIEKIVSLYLVKDK